MPGALSLEFVGEVSLTSAVGLARAQLLQVGRLIVGEGSPAVEASLARSVLQRWRLPSGELLLALDSCEAVLFAADSDEVLDFTIQSAFERGHPLTRQAWLHDCLGEGCYACPWCEVLQ